MAKSNLIDSNLALHMHLTLTLSSAHVKFDVWTGPKTQASKVLKHFTIVKDVFFYPQELLQLISSEQVLVITGETGCGKTTQVWTVVLVHNYASYSSLVNVLGVSLYNVYGFFLRVVVCSKHCLLQIIIFLSGRTVYTGWCYWTRAWIIVSNHLHTT